MRNDHSIVSRDDLSLFNDSVESLDIEVNNHYKREKNIVGLINRPPSGNLVLLKRKLTLFKHNQ